MSVDIAEAHAIDDVLASCSSTEMIFYPLENSDIASDAQGQTVSENALKLYDDNRNGRITCVEARKHGIASVHSSHSAYSYMFDKDGDGVVCE